MQTARQPALRITPAIRKEIVEIIDNRIREVHVTKEDFSELKAIVRDIGVKVGELTEAQKRTESRMEELTEAQMRTESRMEELTEAQKRTESRMEELTEAQKRTESRMEELTEAQKRTESRMEELTEAQKRTESRMEELTEAQKRTEITVEKLAKGLDATRTEMGGLSRSVSYSLENEAYRQLPPFLKERYNIDVTDKMVRLEMEGEEINIFAHGRRDGKDILIVGETELKLSSMGKLRQLEKKVSLIKKHYPGDCIPLLITHFARPAVLDAAKEKGIVVVQSFEW